MASLVHAAAPPLDEDEPLDEPAPPSEGAPLDEAAPLDDVPPDELAPPDEVAPDEDVLPRPPPSSPELAPDDVPREPLDVPDDGPPSPDPELLLPLPLQPIPIEMARNSPTQSLQGFMRPLSEYRSSDRPRDAQCPLPGLTRQGRGRCFLRRLQHGWPSAVRQDAARGHCSSGR